ncbi:MAG: arylsulfatase A-like enzyme [Cognaticolwellia sp.]|jgi:arylsulfatase A-like enzyme
MPTRRELLKGLAATGLASITATSKPAHARKRQRKNLLIISSDEHRHDAMSCAGHPVLQTPRLDSLAAQGMRLTQSVASAPLCAPARQSLLTGLLPSEHGQLGNGFVFDPRHPTLVEAARDAGIYTAGFGKMHLNNGQEDLSSCAGFQRFDAGNTSDIWYITELQKALRSSRPPGRLDPEDEAVWKALAKKDQRFWGMPLDDASLLPDERIAALTHQELEQAPTDRPWLIYCSFRQPHHYWTLPRRHYYRYALELIDTPVLPEAMTRRDRERASRYGWDAMTPEQVAVCRARYYGGIDYIDTQVGAILDRLEDLGLAEDTVVAYISDHGEQLGEHGLWFKGTMHPGSVRVPTIIRAPNALPAGTESEVLLAGVDMLPTLMNLAGWEMPPLLPDGQAISGKDLSTALMGLEPGPSEQFSMMASGRGVDLSMVATQQHRLVAHGLGRERPKALQLFDRKSDPHGCRDIVQESPLTRDLESALDAWLAGLQQPRFAPQRLKAGGAA